MNSTRWPYMGMGDCMAHWAPTWHVLVLLGLLESCDGLLIPRTSFIIGNPDRAVTHFTSPGIENTTTLLLSDDGATLYVGARDALLSLDVSQPGIMELRSKVDWAPVATKIQACTQKGKSEMDCHNFVRVLQFLNTTHIYACGTFAFNPTCTFIDSLTLLSNSHVIQEDGRGRCPFDPYQRNTAIAVDGELYTGTVANFFGDKPVISRFLSEKGQADLRLDDTQGWLAEPTFISSTFISSEDKVYYFFRETSMEYTFINDYTISRVAQVCKSDAGGNFILQKRWTTFAKAQLCCQATADLPFNIIQDMVSLPPPEGASPDDTLFYGVFSSQWSLTSGQSAVCRFRLGDIKNVFAGSFKTLNRATMRWDFLHKVKVASPGQCGLHNASDTKLRYVKENFLAEDSVQPVDRGLVLVSRDQLYSRVVVQRTRAANGRDFTVLFLLTESGFLHKTVVSDKGPHIIEEIQVFKQPQSVKNILLSLTKGVVFVGSSEGVFQIPVYNCSFYSSCAECVLARDPFCGWDPNRLACAEVTSITSGAAQDVELGDVTKTCSASQIGSPGSAGSTVPPEKFEYVRLDEVVRLHCPRASRLALLRWERPSNILHPNTFLQLDDGSLSFLATPHTLGTYHCVAVENGYEQTLAVISVKHRVSPRSITRHHTPVKSQPRTTMKPSLGPGTEQMTTVWAGTRSEIVRDAWEESVREEVTDVRAKTQIPPVSEPIRTNQNQNQNQPLTIQAEHGISTPINETSSTFTQIQKPYPSSNVRSYYGELLVVSFLLVASLCMLMAGVVYIHHQRSSVKSALQDYASTDEETVSTKQCDPPSEHKPLGSVPKPNKEEEIKDTAGWTTPSGSSEELPVMPM
ncbi:hypothetical protein SKAU_G00222430 [Synaphobranchus kaupii]|uniref:Sema domain-containing protein n=1 Tax=Synaphobranchus kaupii TaxID=118154 RepID=A0A9Q1IVZ9_SYNKA|nr:hypothetical protein SKAU_G00222430 [Synaphobranchus kaupii]